MNSDEKSPDHRGWTVLIVLALVLGMAVLAGGWWVRKHLEATPRVAATWQEDSIRVYATLDGPSYVTHLVAYRENGYRRAIAQLPKPVTVIESGSSHTFTRTEIDALPWVDIKGDLATSPAESEAVGVLYFTLRDGGRPAR